MGRGIPKVAGTIADYVLPLKRRRTEGWESGRIGGCRAQEMGELRWEGGFPMWGNAY